MIFALADEPTVSVPNWLEMTAIVAGALAASTRAIREQLAIAGVVALAVCGGLGGGIIRDILLAVGTPLAFTDPWMAFAAMVSCIPALLLSPAVRRLETGMDWIGALSLGLFSILGADRALLAGLPAVGAALIGIISGTGGSVLADLAIGVPPALFRPGRLKGFASALGTAIFVAGAELTDERAFWYVVGVAVITLTRMASILTGFTDVTADHLAARSEKMLRKIPRPDTPEAVRHPIHRWRRRGTPPS